MDDEQIGPSFEMFMLLGELTDDGAKRLLHRSVHGGDFVVIDLSKQDGPLLRQARAGS